MRKKKSSVLICLVEIIAESFGVYSILLIESVDQNNMIFRQALQ